jgi:hypothetical protein
MTMGVSHYLFPRADGAIRDIIFKKFLPMRFSFRSLISMGLLVARRTKLGEL